VYNLKLGILIIWVRGWFRSVWRCCHVVISKHILHTDTSALYTAPYEPTRTYFSRGHGAPVARGWGQSRPFQLPMVCSRVCDHPFVWSPRCVWSLRCV